MSESRAPAPHQPAPEPDHQPEPQPEPATGHPAVDAVLHGVAQVADAAPGDQIPAFQAAHRTLQETLASIDEE